MEMFLILWTLDVSFVVSLNKLLNKQVSYLKYHVAYVTSLIINKEIRFIVRLERFHELHKSTVLSVSFYIKSNFIISILAADAHKGAK